MHSHIDARAILPFMKSILNNQGFLDPKSGKSLDSPPNAFSDHLRIEHWHLSGLYGFNIPFLREYSKQRPEVLIELIDITKSNQRAIDAHITAFPTTKVFVNGIEVGSTSVVIVTKEWLDGLLNF